MDFETQSAAPARIALSEPRRTGGQPLMQSLAKRHSTREFSQREVPEPLLSNLLWAANGINRPDTHGRTVPSARNWQEIDVYLARIDGLFRYDADAHALEPVHSRDVRSLTGMQDFVGSAPLNLVYVADLSKVTAGDPMERRFFCAADAGFIAQNVYLFCASEGLATVVRGLLDRRKLIPAMQLKPQQRALLAQTVGYAAG